MTRRRRCLAHDEKRGSENGREPPGVHVPTEEDVISLVDSSEGERENVAGVDFFRRSRNVEDPKRSRTAREPAKGSTSSLPPSREQSPSSSTATSSKSSLAELLMSSRPAFLAAKDAMDISANVVGRRSKSKLGDDGVTHRNASKGKCHQVNALTGSEARSGGVVESHALVLWEEKHRPKTVSDLIVHKKKIDDMRTWMDGQKQTAAKTIVHGPSTASSSRLLLVSGPTGCGKSITVELLAAELGFEIISWQNSAKESWQQLEHQRQVLDDHSFLHHQSALAAFESFVLKARLSMLPLVVSGTKEQPKGEGRSHGSITRRSNKIVVHKEDAAADNRLAPETYGRPKLLVIEELPFIIGDEQLRRLSAALEDLAIFSRFPVVIIIASTTGANKQMLNILGNSDSGLSFAKSKDLAMMLESKASKIIQFNPVTELKISKILTHILEAEDCSAPPNLSVEKIARDADGDLRHAISTLQFVCLGMQKTKNAIIKKGSAGKKRRKKESECQVGSDLYGTAATVPSTLDRMISRDHSLNMFHALGKLLYNKRCRGHSNESIEESTSPPPKRRVSRDAREIGMARYEEKMNVCLPGQLLDCLKRDTMDGFDPEVVLQQSELSAASVAAFLHENVPSFVEDDAALDLAGCFACISASDRILTMARKSISRHGVEAMADDDPIAGGPSLADAAAASVAARGVCFWNAHPAARRFQPFKSPAMYSAEKGRLENQGSLQRMVLRRRILYGRCLGIESSRMLSTEILPSLRLLYAQTHSKDPSTGHKYLQQQPASWLRFWEGALYATAGWQSDGADEATKAMEEDGQLDAMIEEIEDPGSD